MEEIKKRRKRRRRKYALPTQIREIVLPEDYEQQLTDKGTYGYQWLVNDVYKGLTLDEQRALARQRRGRGRPPKTWLRTLSQPTQEDWDKLCVLTTNTLINSVDFFGNRTSRMRYAMFVMCLPFNYRKVWDKGWPRGRVVGFDDWMVWIEYNSANVLDYMYERGYSKHSSYDIGASLQAFSADMNRVELYNTHAIDKSILELYDQIIGSTD